jgi:hypothetical protein
MDGQDGSQRPTGTVPNYFEGAMEVKPSSLSEHFGILSAKRLEIGEKGASRDR